MLTRGLTAKTRTGFQSWRGRFVTEPPSSQRMLVFKHTRRAETPDLPALASEWGGSVADGGRQKSQPNNRRHHGFNPEPNSALSTED